MKAKISTKMLCIVLSLIMAVTSIPIAAFTARTALALEYDSEAKTLKEKITAYEVKMNGTVYENMLPAYEAYCEAMKLYDKYMYGGDSSIDGGNLTDAASKLDKATEAMKEWTPGSNIEEVKPIQSIDNQPVNQAIFYNNILYSESFPQSIDGASGSGTSEGGIEVKVTHSPSVVFYDGGDNVPGIPVIAQIANYNNEFIYSIYPSKSEKSRQDSKEFTLGYYNYRNKQFYNDNGVAQSEYWYEGVINGGGPARQGTAPANDNGFWLSMYPYYSYDFNNFIWNWRDNKWENTNSEEEAGSKETLDKRLVASNYANGIPGLVSGEFNAFRVPLYNGLKIAYTPGSDEYVKTLTPTWYFTVNNNNIENIVEGGYISNDIPVYVINYKAVTDAVSNKVNKDKLIINNSNTYAAGGLKDVITAFDNIITYNISNSVQNYGDNIETKVNTVGEQIGNYINALNSATPTPDPAEYQGLRDAIDNQRARYEGTSETAQKLYENWEEFANAYQTAQGFMKTKPDNNYPADDEEQSMSNAAKALYAFILNAKAPRVDTILLENTINNAQYVLDNSAFFNADADKISAIKNAVSGAKIAIWKAEENYPLDEFEPEDSEEAEADVEEQMVNIIVQIRNLSINFDAKVDYAGNKSLNDVIKEAEEYINNKDEYANSAGVEVAYNNAKLFMSDKNTQHLIANPTKAFAARDLVNVYKELVLSVYDSFYSLQPSFTTKIKDGQSISSSNENVTVEGSFTNASGDSSTYTFNYTRPNSHVIFRTKSTALDSYNLGPVRMTFYQTSNSNEIKNDNILDSIKLDVDRSDTTYWVTQDYTTSNHWDGSAWTDNMNRARERNGSLTVSSADTANGSAVFSLSKINALSGGNNDTEHGVSFAWAGGDDWIRDSSRDLDGLLSTIEATSSDWQAAGGVFSFGVTTVMRGQLNVTIPADKAYTTNVSDLNENTTPTLTEYKTDNKALGAAFYADPSINKSTRGNGNVLFERSDYEQSLTVIDIAPLVDLMALSEEKVQNSDKYTKESIDKLLEAMAAADVEFSYWTLDAQAILDVVKERYANLWKAYAECEERANFGLQDVTYTDKDGKETSEQFSYEQAREALYEALESNHVTKTFVDELKKRIDGGADDAFKFLNMSSEERASISAGIQDDILAEMKEFLELAAQISKENSDKCVGREYYEAYSTIVNEIPTLNRDAYIVENIEEEAQNNKIASADTINNQPIMVYKSDEEIDDATTAIETAKNSTENHYLYTISVADPSGKTSYVTDENGSLSDSKGDAKEFSYGDTVTVKNPESCAWYEKVTAKTTAKEQTPLLVTFGSSYTFKVRGNTELTVQGGEIESYAKITFINNMHVKNPIAFAYVPEGDAYPLSDAPIPKRMFYTVSGYTDIETETEYSTSESVTVSSDMTLLVKYDVAKEKDDNSYKINIHNLDGSTNSVTAVYNQLVTVSCPGASRIKDQKTGKILAFGETYTFYACQDMEIEAEAETVALTKEHYLDVSVIGSPVVESETHKAQIVGNYALYVNAKYTVTGQGIVLAVDSQPDTLTLGDVDGKNVFNLSVPDSARLATNQFAVSFGYSKRLEAKPSGVPVSYAAYVTYTDDEGKQHTAYSAVIKETLK